MEDDGGTAMLGWHVSVYRKARARRRAAGFGSRTGELLAQWQGGLEALDWLDELVRMGDAVDLGGDGYPKRYTARCDRLRAAVLGGPPEARESWSVGDGDVVDPSLWKGRTHVDDGFRAVPPDEWLVVEAWDES